MATFCKGILLQYGARGVFNMLMRSTGLGKTQLTGHVNEIKRQGDYLIMYVDVVDPVKWKLRVGVNHRDMTKVIKSCGKRSIIQFILSPTQWRKKQADHPGDF
jgi:hypothetical protein